MDWLKVLLIAGTLQGVFLIVVLFKFWNTTNRLLSLLVFMVTLTLTARASFYSSLLFEFPRIALFADLIIFIFGPLFYLYVESVAQKRSHSIKENLKLFYPAFVHLLLVFSSFFVDKEVLVQGYMGNSNWIIIGFTGLFFLAILYNFYFCFLSIRTVRSHMNTADKRTLRFLEKFTYLFGLTISFWFVSFIIDVFKWSFLDNFLSFAYNTTWVFISLYTYILAYYALTNTSFIQNPLNQKYIGSKLMVSGLDQIDLQLEEFMQENKPYLNSKITLSDLAKSLGYNTAYLSRVINEKRQMNYSDYINSYRIKEFERLILTGEKSRQTLLSIAFEAGFNSKGAFNTAFKKITKMTPKEYYEKVMSQMS